MGWISHLIFGLKYEFYCVWSGFRFWHQWRVIRNNKICFILIFLKPVWPAWEKYLSPWFKWLRPVEILDLQRSHENNRKRTKQQRQVSG